MYAIMDFPDDLPFIVGQLAESKSFVKGFRNAWFRCKIKEISWKKDQIGFKAEFYDFPDEEEKWTKLYQVPSYGRKSQGLRKHMMARPHYPPMYYESNMPDVNSISEVVVIVEGAWKVGNLVDWLEKDCYWCGRVTKVLDGDKVQVDLPPPPAGEGGSYEASGKDLRPSLEWSPECGWRLPTPERAISCCARLIHPVNQGKSAVDRMLTTIKKTAGTIPNLKIPPTDVQAAAKSPFSASVSSHISANSLPVPLESDTAKLTSKRPVSMIPSEDIQQTQQVKVDVDPGDSVYGKASSSDSISTSHVQDAKAETAGEDLDYSHGSLTAGETILLNSMCADTLEAAFLDLEEVANKVKWIKSILGCRRRLCNDTRSSWKFVEHHASSTPK